MELVLIISVFLMHHIAKKYDTRDFFENAFLDILVQFLHVATLGLISYYLFVHASLVNIFLFVFNTYTFLKILKAFVINIYYNITEEVNDDEEDDKEYTEKRT